LSASLCSTPYTVLNGWSAAQAVTTLVERSTRYLLLVGLPDGHRSEQVAAALAASIQTLPRQIARSLTWYQGHEMAQHAEFTVATGVTVYFCDPRSPWQRGSKRIPTGFSGSTCPGRRTCSAYPAQARRHRRLSERPHSTEARLSDTVRSTRHGVAMTA